MRTKQRFAVFLGVMNTTKNKPAMKHKSTVILAKPSTGQSVRFIRTEKRLSIEWWVFGEGVVKRKHVNEVIARRMWNKYRNAGFGLTGQTRDFSKA